MQSMRRSPTGGPGRGPANRTSIARWIATIVLLVVAAIFGRDRFPEQRPGASDPFPPSVRGAARLVDGDSLFVGRDEVRLQGIDAPEGRQMCTLQGKPWACGNASRDALARLIGKDVVICNIKDRDQHGRLLSFCTAGGRDLNRTMVESGMAVSYGSYRREEADARTAKRGLWGSEFQQPRAWRDEHNTSHR